MEEDNNFPRERVVRGKGEDGRICRVSYSYYRPIRISFYRFKNCSLFPQFSWTEVYEVNEVGANEAPALIRSPIVTFLVRVEHRTVWKLLSFIIILLVLHFVNIFSAFNLNRLRSQRTIYHWTMTYN